MADLQARIGPKVTKQYPHRTWKRPGADLQSPSKNSVKWSQARQSDEKDDDSDASSREHASSPTLSSPTKSKHRSSPQRRDSGGQLSLLTRMGLSSGVSEDGASEGREAVGMQQSLLPRVGTTEDTPRFSPNIGSTRDSVHDPDSNGYHDTANSKHASPQHPLPSSLVCLPFFFFCHSFFRSNCFPATRFRMVKETSLLLKNEPLMIETIVSPIIIQIAVK